ncbi:MAG: hypothetical protein R3B36_22565 [Polyangiaceae bacterium]
MLTSPSRFAAASLCIAIAGGCAQGEDGATRPSFAEPDASAPAPSGPGGAFGDSGTAPPDANIECAEETKQVYVLATDKALYRFDPQPLKFTRVGTLNCPATAGTFSMAVDRRGTAWVEYTDGNLFEVDTRTAKCKPTAFKAGQTGFETFGMGFASDAEGSSAETLFMAGAGLASLDTKTFAVTYRGSLALGRTELTGRGAELFAFSVSSGTVANLDKATAATIKSYRTTAIDPASAFAFAHWGGDFWIFTGTDNSIVTQYSPATDTSKVVVQNAGILIVGAGSSTCAPTTPPR